MAAWALMNSPSLRSKDNTRPGVLAVTEPEEPAITLSAEEISRRNLEQPPLFLLLNRTGPTTLELSNVLTNEVIYKVQDTGRGRLSSKPDYEVYRPGSGDLFVGSIRIGVRGTEIKLPLTNVHFSDAEVFGSRSGRKLKWTTSQMRQVSRKEEKKADEDARRDSASWAVVLECSDENKASKEDESVCVVRLIDTLPNGRFEIWTKDACVDVGGDWNLLDELVTVAYANMEIARRKVLSRRGSSNIGIAGMNLTMGAGV